MTGLLSTQLKNASRMDEQADSLVQRAKSGCHEAYAELIRRNNALVRSILGRYLRNDEEVDEVAQRVFVAAYRALPRFQTRSSLQTWLVSIARNQVASYRRGEARRRKRESLLTEDVITQWTDADESNQDADVIAAKIDALSLCVEQLPEHSREIIHRYYFDRESITSISQGKERTPGSLRMMLMRIRQALALCISKRLSKFEG